MTLLLLYCASGLVVTLLASTDRRDAAKMFNRWADKAYGDQRAYYQDLARGVVSRTAIVCDALLWPLTIIRYFLGKF